MGHPRFTGDTIAQRGQELYASTIQSQVETEANIGKILCIDIETCDYAVADDGITKRHSAIETPRCCFVCLTHRL